MSANSKESNGGVGIISLLTLLFVGLKLAGEIDWSWWWVLSPVWIIFGILLLMVTLIILVKVMKGFKQKDDWRYK